MLGKADHNKYSMQFSLPRYEKTPFTHGYPGIHDTPLKTLIIKHMYFRLLNTIL